MAQETIIMEATEVVVLTPEMEQQIKEANEKLILAQLSSLPINKEQLAALQDLKSLKIQGLGDKGGYKLVDTERKRVKQIRLAIQRREKEILETPKEFINRVKSGVSEWVEELGSIEEHLQSEQTQFEQLERDEKRRKQELEDQMINDRCAKIDATGAVLKGQSYFIGEHAIHMNDVCDFKDDEFNRWIDQANAIGAELAKEKAKADLISKRKSEINQLGMFYNEELGVFIRFAFDTTVTEEQLFEMSIEEFNQFHSDLSAFHIAEKQKMEEFERKQKEQAEEQKRMEDEKLKIKRDRGNNRHLALANLGFSLIGEGYYLDGTNQNFTKTEIFESEEDEWTLIIASAQEKSEQYNQELDQKRIEREEKEAKDRLFKNRCATLAAFGMVLVPERTKIPPCMELEIPGSVKFNLLGLVYRVDLQDIYNATDEQFEGYKANAQKSAQDRQKRLNEIASLQAQEDEAIRKAELQQMRPDGEILKALVESAKALKVDASKMKSTAGVKGAERANHAIDLCVKELANITIDFE